MASAGAAGGRGAWRFWIDRGGTFTDLVGLAPDRSLVVRKVISEQPARPGLGGADPAVNAIRGVLGLATDEPLPQGLVEEVRLGTTVATNALLERRLEPVLLLVNRGFADLSLIGEQHRPDIFALRIERPEPLPHRVLEVPGRLAADGAELEPLVRDPALEARLLQALAEGWRSCAVALLHAVVNPAHELSLGAWLEELGFHPVLLSHQVGGLPRLLPRLQTTLAEAAVRPVLRSYLRQVATALGPATRLRVMTSAGVLQPPDHLLAKDTILSGPAGGLVGAVAVARAAGLGGRPILGFDMGGTSTDVFHLEAPAPAPAAGADDPEASPDRAVERNPETLAAGLRLQALSLPIHTVAAGGGSVLRFEGGRLQVGPDSAGALPGPACYRQGGPLTLTDANLLLGRLPQDALPPVFGPGGDQPADADLVRERFEALAASLSAGFSAEALAQGACSIALERMAEAIRRISIQRGHDISEAVLVSYGGAGGQHACALAGRLGVSRVLLHPLAGVLSAYGIGLSRQEALRTTAVQQPLRPSLLADLIALREALLDQACRDLERAGDGPADRQAARVVLDLRLRGGESGLEVPWPAGDDGDALRQAFEARHRQRFGYVVAGEELVVERLLVQVPAAASALAAAASRSPEPRAAGAGLAELPPPRWLSLCLPEQGADAAADRLLWRQVPCWRREELQPGQRLQGPALLLEATGTTVLEPGWGATVLADACLLLEPLASAGHGAAAIGGTEIEPAGIQAAAAPLDLDPVRLELYNHRFAAIAEQMGVRLQQSSRSVNIRERLDFSCALFDSGGRLVANAPHIPVHLGSMGESVAALLAAIARGERPPLRPGDAIASNDPYAGGTHLPDITVITPVFAREDPLFYVACRAHHADVGGSTPGSMPPFSRSILEEGLRLDNVPLITNGSFAAEAWRQRLEAGDHPVRDPERLLADLQAQVAANRLGEMELQRLIRQRGVAEVVAGMEAVQRNAAEAVRSLIDRLRSGRHVVELDDRARIVVAIEPDHQRRRLRVDFSGTSPQQSGNLNAPLAITKAVVLYVVRVMLARPIPLNAGCFEPIDLVVPPGCLLRPGFPAAVVGGNVETSQAVANALFGALGVLAAGQGTMNNLSFGNDRCQYYETVAGGSGAGALAQGEGFDGCDAVQSHMTNSRLTDPEILEARFPVRLERFARRRGSGGAGRWRGGDGVVRLLRALEPITLAILSGSRRVPPFGLAGGGAGQCGRNQLLRADGTSQELPGSAQLALQPGDAFLLETPGGGGWGVEPSPAADPATIGPGVVS